jgi:DNA-binding CsgD family transcriptional regulator
MAINSASSRRLVKATPSKVSRSAPRATTFRISEEQFLVLSEPAGAPPSAPGLSPCEAEVAGLVLKGCSNDEIARERGVRYGTVANQLASVYRKLDVGSRVELIARLRDLPRTQLTFSDRGTTCHA